MASRGCKSHEIEGKRRPASHEAADLAHKLANDISEGIDAGESRQKLREAIAYWADEATDQCQMRVMAESDMQVVIGSRKLIASIMAESEKRMRKCRKR